jgi:nucleoside diphosphate kinase
MTVVARHPITMANMLMFITELTAVCENRKEIVGLNPPHSETQGKCRRSYVNESSTNTDHYLLKD